MGGGGAPRPVEPFISRTVDLNSSYYGDLHRLNLTIAATDGDYIWTTTSDAIWILTASFLIFTMQTGKSFLKMKNVKYFEKHLLRNRIS